MDLRPTPCLAALALLAACGHTTSESPPPSTPSATTVSRGPRAPSDAAPDAPRARFGDVAIAVLPDDVVFLYDAHWVARATIVVENVSEHEVRAGANSFRANGLAPSGAGSNVFSTIGGGGRIAPGALVFGEVAWEVPAAEPAPTALEIDYVESDTARPTHVATVALVHAPAPVVAGWVPSSPVAELPITLHGPARAWPDHGGHGIDVQVAITLENPTDAALVVRREMIRARIGAMEAADSGEGAPTIAYDQHLDPGATREGTITWYFHDANEASAIDVVYGSGGAARSIASAVPVETVAAP